MEFWPSECNRVKPGNAMLNPTALRTAKTLWSFGHSECNRVKNCISKENLKENFQTLIDFSNM